MDKAASSQSRIEVDPGRRATETADRFATAIGRIDETRLDHPVPTCGKWVVRDLVEHVATLAAWYLDAIDGDGHFARTPREMDVINAANLARARERPMAELADDLRHDARSLAERLTTLPPDELLPYHAGSALPPLDILTLFTTDVLVHGYDLARALKGRWTIADDAAIAAFDAMMPLAPRWVDDDAAAGHTANYEIRLRGGPVHHLAFRDGKASSELAPGERIDCHISGDPTTLLLVMLRRISAQRAAIAGKSIAWGRRPWLAFRLAHRLQPV